MEYRLKGSKILLDRAELNQYLERKVLELSATITNIVMALIIVSLVVILNFFLVSDYYLLALIVIPLIGRGFLHARMESWLRGTFKELVEIIS
ncbi:MAG: hypothetical protein ACLFVT_03665 [Syntrophobacteria bacterium]